MLVFNEGVPRSGKSYDAVKTHVIPALQAGRRVYARLNGLNVQAIAEYMQVPVATIEPLLFQVPTSEVRKFFCAQRDKSGQWSISDDLKDALFVIDEAHEFYVASRNAIEPEVEQFFALCGQNGMDGVLMSQFYRRLHSSVRVRIERKNVFQKLTALGMEGKYTSRQYQTTEPDKFVLIDTTVCTYDPKIFPLYHGYAPGAGNTAVYKSGGVTIWKRLARYGVPIGLCFIAAVWYLAHEVSTGGRNLVKTQPQSGTHVGVPNGVSAQPGPTQAFPSRAVASQDDRSMPDEVRYVFDLCKQARPRLAGVVDVPGRLPAGVIEWPKDEGKGTVQDRLTFDQLRDLGVTIQVHQYGVKLMWQKQAVIVTSWPLTRPMEERQSTEARSGAVASSGGVEGASAAAASAGWKSSVMASDYVPPELMKRPEYAPHTHG